MKTFFVIALLLTTGLSLEVAQVPAQKAQTPAKKTATEKLAKLIAPWPEPAAMKARHADADSRALFRSVEPLAFTLESDFSTVNKDRNPDSTKTFPATLKIAGADGQEKTVALNISGRGHLRRMSVTCGFIPLRLEFQKDAVKGTALEGQANALKLVTHCQSSQAHEQFILREYLAYKVSNVLLPYSFRARLTKVTYVDSKTAKPLTTRYGIILEDDGDVARRMEGRTVSVAHTSFVDLEPKTLDRMMVFEYLLGNTDYSIFALHNVVLVQMPPKILYTVPYDFDLSGLVHAPYALPAPRLGITSVTERVYRGACRTAEELEPTLEQFRAKKAEVLALPDTILDMNADTKKEVRSYLNDFFDTLDRPAAVKKAFITSCDKRTTM